MSKGPNMSKNTKTVAIIFPRSGKRGSSAPRKSLLIDMATLSDYSEEEEEKCNLLQKCFCLPAKIRAAPFTSEETEENIHKLHKYCLTHSHDSYRVHLNRLKGVRLIREIIARIDADDLRYSNIMSMVWCIISCVHHFYIRLRPTGGMTQLIRRRQAKKSMHSFEKLLQLLLPEYLDSVLNAMMSFFAESKMWNAEHVAGELLERLLLFTEKTELAIHAVMDLAEKKTTSNPKGARQIIHVLYEVLKTFPWTDIDDALMTRLLTIYHKSLMPDAGDEFDYEVIHKGMEVVIRHILENLPNVNLLKVIKVMLQWTCDKEVPDEALLDFGNVVEYAAMLHDTRFYRDLAQDDLISLILKLIASDNGLYSLLGNRVLQNLMDRHNNIVYFDTPRIFFEGTFFNISAGIYMAEDKRFLRKHREMMHAALLSSVQLHGIHRLNLESTYSSIAILLVEVPCGFTAAAVACLSMAVQEYTIGDETIQLECTHHFHAMVMSLLSLICWVHKAEIFYDYVNVIMARRSSYAPHLNPPLRPMYEYAQHHVLWNKPELFFQDWEVRYGLWKCFRSKRNRRSDDAITGNEQD